MTSNIENGEINDKEHRKQRNQWQGIQKTAKSMTGSTGQQPCTEKRNLLVAGGERWWWQRCRQVQRMRAAIATRAADVGSDRCQVHTGFTGAAGIQLLISQQQSARCQRTGGDSLMHVRDADTPPWGT
jgi:hypothetical protein